MLYYKGQVDTLHEQSQTKDGEIKRLRQALNIEKPDPSLLVELTNDELRAKATHTAGIIRDICFDFSAKSQQLQKQWDERKVAPAQRIKLLGPVATEFAERFDREAKADFLNIDSELRNRLGPEGRNGIVMMPEINAKLFAASGLPFFQSLELCNYADELDQMAKRLLPTPQNSSLWILVALLKHSKCGGCGWKL
jgi:hypothetical protein